MIQRMGRVLRKKKDDRPARIVIIYVKGTAEDPSMGAYEAFLEIIREAADDEAYFDGIDHADFKCDYLDDWVYFM